METINQNCTNCPAAITVADATLMMTSSENHKLDILGVSGVRWTGADKIFIKEEKMQITRVEMMIYILKEWQ